MTELEIESRESQVSIRACLVGVWNLRSYTNIHNDGLEIQPFGTNPAGVLIYTMNGFVSAQLMNPERAPSQRGDWDDWTAEEYQLFGRGFIGYCGRYEIDEDQATVTHVPSVAFAPNLVGQRLLREVTLTDDLLTLKASFTLADGSSATSILEWSPTIRCLE